MKISEWKELVFDANLELVRRGLVLYTWGNVSALDRERGLVIIKPRGIAYEELVADDMSVTDLDGKIVEGKLLPSVDLDIHLAMYRQFAGISAIAHTHSTYATAWAQARRSIPVYGTTHGDHFYGAIPCTRGMQRDEMGEAYEKKTGELVVDTFLKQGIDPMNVPGVLVAGHGPFTWGKDPQEAVENSVILEELARIAVITEQIETHTPCLESYMLDRHFLRKHGAGAYFYQTKG